MPLHSIYDVDCPYCGAVAGLLCRAHPSLDVRATPHVLRTRSFRVATRKTTGPDTAVPGPVAAAETDEDHEAAPEDGNTTDRTTT